MNIAMIGHKRIPGREGGVEVVVEELAVRMANCSNCVTVYNRKEKKYKTTSEYKNVNIVNIPTISSKNLNAILYSLLASLHATIKKYDIIHYHAIGPSSMLIIPHFLRKKVIVTVHGLNYKTPKWKGFGEWYLKLSEKIVAKYADEIIVLSKEQKKYFWEKYKREIQFIPNGVTLKDIQPAHEITEKWNLKKDGYFLFLSRIVPGKGLEYLIEAFKQLNTNKKLVIVGEGVFVDGFLEKIYAMCEGDNRIVFTGYASGIILDELYSNAFAFVFPSEAEGMPMCLLEALSYNCRCIVSDIPENVVIVKQYGRTFKNKDVKDLLEKMKALVNAPETVIESRSYISETYQWDKIVEQTLQLYRSTL